MERGNICSTLLCSDEQQIQANSFSSLMYVSEQDRRYLTSDESCRSSLHTFHTDQAVLFVYRCNCVSLVDGISDHAAAKAWEQRWVRACVCGGSWRRLPFKEQQNVVAAATPAQAAAAGTSTAAVPVASQ